MGDTEFTNQEIDYPALLRLDVGNLDECPSASGGGGEEDDITRQLVKRLIFE